MKARSTADERARECGCPSWVKSCVHFDGQAVRLYDGTLVPDCEYYRGGLSGRYRLSTATGTWKPHQRCGRLGFSGKTHAAVFDTDDYDEARDEFRRREAVLLGREAQ